MGFFGSRAILEVVSQKLNLKLSVLKRGEHGYERKKGEEKREKKGNKKEREENYGASVRGEFFSSFKLFK